MRRPTYDFVIDQDRQVFELVYGPTSWHYRRVTLERTKQPGRLRGLRGNEAMVRIGLGKYVPSHACVNACHCPCCGADVGNLCFGKRERTLKFSVHYARRDLYYGRTKTRR
jgi:hypothetical protein